jgi:hypothetical protein
MGLPIHPVSVEELTTICQGGSPRKPAAARSVKAATEAILPTLDTYEKCYCVKCDSLQKHLVVESPIHQTKLVAVKCETCGETGLVRRDGLLGLKSALSTN